MKIAICIHGNIGSKKRAYERGYQLNKKKLLIENNNNNNLFNPLLGPKLVSNLGFWVF
jgi:hypothetical protein